jgi:flagellin-specific chaperone FliS
MMPMPMVEVARPALRRAGHHQEYRTQQVLGASPMQLVLMLYEMAIVGCEARDAQRARGALTELIGALNFEPGDVAVSLFRLYEYCLWEIRRDRFDAAARVLRDLKRAWDDAHAAHGTP